MENDLRNTDDAQESRRDDIIILQIYSKNMVEEKRSPTTVGDFKFLICILHDLWMAGDERGALGGCFPDGGHDDVDTDKASSCGFLFG